MKDLKQLNLEAHLRFLEFLQGNDEIDFGANGFTIDFSDNINGIDDFDDNELLDYNPMYDDIVKNISKINNFKGR